MTLETEVKFYIADLDEISARLHTAGAQQSHRRIFEQNLRYENAAQTLAAQDVVLRLRQDDRARLTYKQALPEQSDTRTTTRLELETEVGDFATMDAILHKLGFYVAMAYEKYRTTYTLHGAEIMLDEMPFGNFIEVEGLAEPIEQVVAALGLGGAPRFLVSYVALFEAVKARLGLTLRDLTFAAFEGVELPDAIFE